MRPEKIEKTDSKETFIEYGISEEWVDIIQQLGYKTLDSLKEVKKHTRLHQEICGYNKKNKLELNNPSQDEVLNWLSD